MSELALTAQPDPGIVVTVEGVGIVIDAEGAAAPLELGSGDTAEIILAPATPASTLSL